MPTTITRPELRKAVELAVHAPSIHNTQPWRWSVTDSALRLSLDEQRVLTATDPDRHAAAVSCGATLRLARLALTAHGWQTTVDYDPDPDQPDLLAELLVTGHRYVAPHDAALAAAVRSRVSDRRLLDAGSIAAAQWDSLQSRSSEASASVHLVRPGDEELWLTVLTAHAEASETADSAQVAELRDWVRQDEPADDGVPQWAVPEVVGEPRHSNIPQRGFAGPGQPGGLTVPGGVDEHPVFALVMTPHDTRHDHVRAGEVMMQLMLEAWLANVASCPASQVVDHVDGRMRLGQAFGGVAIPQMVLRLGTPLGRGVPTPTPRRSADAVIDE